MSLGQALARGFEAPGHTKEAPLVPAAPGRNQSAMALANRTGRGCSPDQAHRPRVEAASGVTRARPRSRAPAKKRKNNAGQGAEAEEMLATNESMTRPVGAEILRKIYPFICR